MRLSKFLCEKMKFWIDEKKLVIVRNPRKHNEFSPSLEQFVTYTLWIHLWRKLTLRSDCSRSVTHWLNASSIICCLKDLHYESSNSWVLCSVHRRKLIQLKASEKRLTEHKLSVYKKQSPCSLASDSLGKDPLTQALKWN